MASVDLADVNVLIYAHGIESTDHGRYAEWLEQHIAGPAPFGVSELVLSGFVRIVTSPQVFGKPTPLPQALAFCRSLLEQPTCRRLRPGPNHFEIFERLCSQAGVRGKLVSDAYHAALAIEHGCQWITTDGDFARFPGLKTRHPLQA